MSLPSIIEEYLAMARPKKVEIEKPSTEAVSADILFKQYQVMNDGIVASDESLALGISVLKGLVTRADIERAGGDFEWLLSSGAIQEAGYGR